MTALHIAILQDHLAMANRHVASGNRVIARQQQLIVELESNRHDTREALSLLAKFEDSQSLHLAGRDRLIKELRSAEA